jgi:hypothetical protein
MNPEIVVTTFAGDGHPDESQLLLALEQELPPEGIAEIERHLGQCWSCRARSDEMRRGILAFVEYRENRYLPSLAQPPNEFRNFPGELRKVVHEGDSPSLTTRLKEALAALLTLPASIRWSTAIAFVAALALFWTHVLFNPSIVSASEFLARAIAAQNPGEPAQSFGRKAVHQRIQVRSGARSVIRDFSWMAADTTHSPAWEITDNPEKWNSPMTAEGFSLWRNSLVAKTDAVTRSQQLLTLTTTPSTGSIKAASLVVRAADFHPLEQHIVFANEQVLDFFEMGFEVLEVTPGNEISRQAPSPGPTRGGKVHKDLGEIEMTVRYQLFTDTLDLGEDLQIDQAGNEVIVSGVASSKERADAIKSLLSKMDGVRVRVSFPQAASISSFSANPKKAAVAQAVSLAEALLSKEFPSSNERAYFVNAWLAASDKTLAHAWAMKRLAERYSEQDESNLSPASVDKLGEMLRVHLRGAGQANADLESLLKLLPSSAEATPLNPSDLRSGIMLLFRNAQEQDSLTAKLVASTPAAGEDLSTASRKLRDAHRAIQFLSVSLRDDL